MRPLVQSVHSNKIFFIKKKSEWEIYFICKNKEFSSKIYIEVPEVRMQTA